MKKNPSFDKTLPHTLRLSGQFYLDLNGVIIIVILGYFDMHLFNALI